MLLLISFVGKFQPQEHEVELIVIVRCRLCFIVVDLFVLYAVVVDIFSACNQLQLHAVHNSVRNFAAFFARGLGLLSSVLISGVRGSEPRFSPFRKLFDCGSSLGSVTPKLMEADHDYLLSHKAK